MKSEPLFFGNKRRHQKQTYSIGLFSDSSAGKISGGNGGGFLNFFFVFIFLLQQKKQRKSIISGLESYNSQIPFQGFRCNLQQVVSVVLVSFEIAIFSRLELGKNTFWFCCFSRQNETKKLHFLGLFQNALLFYMLILSNCLE